MAMNPASRLGATGEHMPLINAAIHVACVRAPDVVFPDLDALIEGRHCSALAELARALDWIAAMCAEPGGLPCAYQDPGTGDLSRLPAPLIWQAVSSAGAAEAPDVDRALQPFREAAEATGVKQCDAGREVVVPRSELDARLGAEGPMLTAWIGSNLETVMRTLERAVDRDPNAISSWAFSLVKHQLPTILALHETLREVASQPEPAPERRRVTTKDAVAGCEAEFRRRWEAGEFDSPSAARRQLEVEVNARPDGTCARRGDPDYHGRASIDRLTRGWFRRRS